MTLAPATTVTFSIRLLDFIHIKRRKKFTAAQLTLELLDDAGAPVEKPCIDSIDAGERFVRICDKFGRKTAFDNVIIYMNNDKKVVKGVKNKYQIIRENGNIITIEDINKHQKLIIGG